jgi:hypothetical protein
MHSPFIPARLLTPHRIVEHRQLAGCRSLSLDLTESPVEPPEQNLQTGTGPQLRMFAAYPQGVSSCQLN